MAEEKTGKRLKEEKKQEMQQKSQEDVQREETFKTWLTGLHRRRKVRLRISVTLIGCSQTLFSAFGNAMKNTLLSLIYYCTRKFLVSRLDTERLRGILL